MISYHKYKQALDIVRLYKQQCLDAIGEIDSITDKEDTLKESNLFDNISIRIINVFMQNQERFHIDRDSSIGDLSNVSRAELRRTRNMGVKAMIVIDVLCHNCGVKMLP